MTVFNNHAEIHHVQRRTNPPGPLAFFWSPLPRAVVRVFWRRLLLTLRPTLDTRGGNAGLEVFRADGASSTRMETSPILTSLGILSVLSRNRSLFDFLGRAKRSSSGGVGGRITGSAFRISSGSRAGRAARRAS